MLVVGVNPREQIISFIILRLALTDKIYYRVYALGCFFLSGGPRRRCLRLHAGAVHREPIPVLLQQACGLSHPCQPKLWQRAVARTRPQSHDQGVTQ